MHNSSLLGIGTDLVEVRRLENALTQYGERFLSRIFSETERAYCDQFGEKRVLHYAARFAAKEAFSKAIGTGMTQGMTFSKVAVINDTAGAPHLELFGDIKDKWEKYIMHVSLSHTDNYAQAVVIIESTIIL